MDWMETVLVRRYRGPAMGRAAQLRLIAMRLSFPDYKADLKARLLWGLIEYPFDESDSDWLVTSQSESSDSDESYGMWSGLIAKRFQQLGRRANNAIKPGKSCKPVRPLRQRPGETRRAYESRMRYAKNWAYELGLPI